MSEQFLVSHPSHGTRGNTRPKDARFVSSVVETSVCNLLFFQSQKSDYSQYFVQEALDVQWKRNRFVWLSVRL